MPDDQSQSQTLHDPATAVAQTPPNDERFERASKSFRRLCEIMARLRGPGGCAWDREQTLETLKTYLIEEAYETLEAIDSGDPREHMEELGDLLLQIVFQAEITHQERRFDVADAVDAINDKLVRRHPHIFGGAPASAGGTLETWEAIKADERPREASCLDGVPPNLPALLRAYRTGEKAAAVGFDWPSALGPFEKIEEELSELRTALKQQQQPDEIRRELGDLLFSVVNLARHLKVDPEDCLRQTIMKFHTRFQYVERRLAATGRRPKQASLDELNVLWDQAKLASGAGGSGPSR